MITLAINDVPIACINQAALAYHVPSTLIISILKTENGRNGMANKNLNGSYDFGPMQINSMWLPRIKPYGFTQKDLQYNPCANVQVGAWILSTNIAREGTLWKGVGDYHSHTASLNHEYHIKVKNSYTSINSYLYKNERNAS